VKIDGAGADPRKVSSAAANHLRDAAIDAVACEISQSGRDALAWARFNFWVIPAGSRKYGGGSCNPSMLRSYFAPA
jgi:hypothetical protein